LKLVFTNLQTERTDFMSNNPHRCVIDRDGYYVTFVLLVEQADGSTAPYSYSLKSGESIIDASPPSNMIALRWIGTAWEETGTRTITEKDLEQLRTSKLQMINVAAQQAIYDGVTIGNHTFSLTEVDQINISTLAAQLQAAMRGEESSIDLTKGVPYHADGELCRHWPPEEFAAIAQAATAHAFYHQAYCNHLRQYIKDVTDYSELGAVYYGMGLTPTMQASMAALLGVNEA